MLATLIRCLTGRVDSGPRRAARPSAEQNWMDDQEQRLQQLEHLSHEHRLDLLQAEVNAKRRRLQRDNERKANGYG